MIELAGAAVARPGDVLVVAVNRHLSQAEKADLQARLREYLPELRQVLVVEAAQLLIFQPDDVAAAGAGG